jgi:glycogen operon protein
VVGEGVEFAVHAPYADSVDVCLFDEGREVRLTLPQRSGSLHYGLVEPAGPGTIYGFRANGLWAPDQGIFTNPAKLLLDPYARRITGTLSPGPELVTHRPRAEDRPDLRDNSHLVPRSVVVDDQFDWEGDRPPLTAWADTVIYEAHVRGLTLRHPAVEDSGRGTYRGLASRPVVEHLRALGITAVELMPTQRFLTEAWLTQRGLANYWGYATVGFFAPHEDHAAGDPITEFRAMVKALHSADIEVLLDVVYNHTAEGNHQGATLCFRGLDNPGFYRLDPERASRYVDWTGTGNTVDLTSPWALQIVMDSLRFWVEDMHVDGFRFDLAPVMGRIEAAFTTAAGFFKALHQDPTLRRVKLIAEPWDMGPDGYLLGGFPSGWSEWNGRFRDRVRDCWRGSGSPGDLIASMSGSPDVFPQRGSDASVNYVACHDGFTLADTVSYDRKANLANGEHNRDGSEDNRSWNGGHEGETSDPGILDNRRRRARAMLATVFLASGVPMLLAGDELGRTQRGNNNAYCQDNEISWVDWEQMDWDLTAFVQELSAMRRKLGLGSHRPSEVFAADGSQVDEHGSTALTFMWADTALALVNATAEVVEFAVPLPLSDAQWTVAFDSASELEPGSLVGSIKLGPWTVSLATPRPA